MQIGLFEFQKNQNAMSMFVRMEPLQPWARAEIPYRAAHAPDVTAEGVLAHAEASLMRVTNVRSSVSIKEKNRIKRIVEDLRKAEKAESIRDRRSSERVAFVHPVLISIGRDKNNETKATSKDLSSTGIGLMHDVPFEVGRIGVLKVFRLHDDPLLIRAECRWCKPFCQSWFVSGWRFSRRGTLQMNSSGLQLIGQPLA